MATGAATMDDRAYKFDAGALANAWLAVELASGRDEQRPALNRTLLVELFRDGIRLVATDGYVLLTGWVATSAFEEPPEFDEAPETSVVAIDGHGRGAGLMAHLRRLAAEAAENGLPLDVTVRLGKPPIDPTQTLMIEGLESQALIIDHPGREELALPLFEGDYPAWRGIIATHEAEAPDAIALNLEIIGRLAKLGKFFDDPLVWRFGGAEGVALLEIGPVRGAAMPVRWPGIGPEEPKSSEAS